MPGAHSHVSALRTSRTFHYIDEESNDQGINGNVFRALTMFLLTIFLFASPSAESDKSLLGSTKANQPKNVGIVNEEFFSEAGSMEGLRVTHWVTIKVATIEPLR